MLLILVLFLPMLGLRCFSLLTESESHSPVAVLELLVAVAAVVAEQGP